MDVGVNELTALAATSELAPTSKRGQYVAVLIFTIVPFVPSVMYGQLIAYYSTWRWCGLICAIWAFIGFLMIAFFYFPPPRVNSAGMSRKEVLRQIDFLGGILSIGGMLLFMVSSSSLQNFRLLTTIKDGHAVGRISVRLGQCPRIGAPNSRSCHASSLRGLAGIRPISNVPKEASSRPTNPRPDSGHNVYQWEQFLLHPHVCCPVARLWTLTDLPILGFGRYKPSMCMDMIPWALVFEDFQ